MKVRVCYPLQSIKLLVTFRFMGVVLKLVISFSVNNSSGNPCGEQNHRVSCDRRRLEVGKYALFCTQFSCVWYLKLFMEFDLRMHLWGNLCCCRLGLFQIMTCWLWTPYLVIGPTPPLNVFGFLCFSRYFDFELSLWSGNKAVNYQCYDDLLSHSLPDSTLTVKNDQKASSVTPEFLLLGFFFALLIGSGRTENSMFPEVDSTWKVCGPFLFLSTFEPECFSNFSFILLFFSHCARLPVSHYQQCLVWIEFVSDLRNYHAQISANFCKPAIVSCDCYECMHMVETWT